MAGKYARTRNDVLYTPATGKGTLRQFNVIYTDQQFTHTLKVEKNSVLSVDTGISQQIPDSDNRPADSGSEDDETCANTSFPNYPKPTMCRKLLKEKVPYI
jgi:hypothetical protein